MLLVSKKKIGGITKNFSGITKFQFGIKRPTFQGGWFLLTNKYFCTIYDYAGKEDLSMGYWNAERKVEVAGHFFLEIIEQQLF